MMRPANEQNFDASLKTVTPVSSTGENIGCLTFTTAGMVVAIYWLIAGAMQWWRDRDLWVFLSVLAALLFIMVLVFNYQEVWQAMLHRRTLRQHGTPAKATVVGRLVEDQNESDVYYVYYQFRPDFVGKYCDATGNQRYYQLPVGAELDVRFLSENPEIHCVEKLTH